jgi:hypothetical protein
MMKKTEFHVRLAPTAQTNKRAVGVFLDTLASLAYEAIKKNGEFVRRADSPGPPIRDRERRIVPVGLLDEVGAVQQLLIKVEFTGFADG